MNVILTPLAEGIQVLPWRRRAIFSRLPASVPHHLDSRSSFRYMTLFKLEHCLMKKHLRVDGAGDAVVELGIELGKLVAEKKRIIVQKSEQEISSAH